MPAADGAIADVADVADVAHVAKELQFEAKTCSNYVTGPRMRKGPRRGVKRSEDDPRTDRKSAGSSARPRQGALSVGRRRALGVL